MRYRPFGDDGRSSSAISLSIPSGGTARQACDLVCGALECGVNTFSMAAGDEAAADALQQAVASVGRRVLIVMLRLELGGASFEQQARAALRTSGVGFFDAAMIDPADGDLSPAALSGLQSLRTGRMAARLALVADAAGVQSQLDGVTFDIAALRYNVTSGWAERNVLKNAAQRGLTMLGYGFHIDEEAVTAPDAPRGFARLFRREEAARPAAYRFLEQTPGWSPRQITLAFALTEPGLASVLVETASPEELEALCWVVERELPAGVAAQIEMARFAAGPRREVA